MGSDKVSVGFFGEALLELDSADVTWCGDPDTRLRDGFLEDLFKGGVVSGLLK